MNNLWRAIAIEALYHDLSTLPRGGFVWATLPGLLSLDLNKFAQTFRRLRKTGKCAIM